MLTVIVPTYNRPAMLRECLASVVPQANDDIQIIVADDCSRQDTIDTICEFVGDGRVGYYAQHRNVGVQANVQHIIDHTQGDYICVVPDDDTVNPGNFARKVKVLDEHPEIGFVYSRVNIMDAAGKPLGIVGRGEYADFDYVGTRDEFRDLLSGNWIYGASVVFRRSLVERYGYQDTTLPATLADWDVWLRYAALAGTAYIAEPLVNVRLHEGALSMRDKGMALAMLQVWKKWLTTNADPPYIESETWNRMRMIYTSEVYRLIAGDKKREDAIAKFNALHLLYATKMRVAA